MKNMVDIKKKLANNLAKAQKNAKNKRKALPLVFIKWAITNIKLKRIKILKNIFFDLKNKNKNINNKTFILVVILSLKKLKRVNSINQTNKKTKKTIS